MGKQHARIDVLSHTRTTRGHTGESQPVEH